MNKRNPTVIKFNRRTKGATSISETPPWLLCKIRTPFPRKRICLNHFLPQWHHKRDVDVDLLFATHRKETTVLSVRSRCEGQDYMADRSKGQRHGACMVGYGKEEGIIKRCAYPGSPTFPRQHSGSIASPDPDRSTGSLPSRRRRKANHLVTVAMIISSYLSDWSAL
jgi:hypothetical protein